MTLRFPNASRSYDETKRCVSFWGHDSTIEVAFQMDEDALRGLSPQMDYSERSFLTVFDANRDEIERVAGKAYAKRRQSYHRLMASDF
jgi:hypothetical protein